MITAFLLGVGVMCALTTVLAVVLLIAEATIANYGDVTLTVNDSRTLEVEGGSSLLSTLKEQQLFIPSACGGRGSCGLCKVQVLEGGGDPLPTELPWLSEDERRDGTRLSCQLRVKSDLKLRVPEELFNVRQYKTTVASLRDLTHDIKEVRLRLDDPAEISFVAGQFIQFEVPPYELTDEPVYRAYSISSNPQEQNGVELEIRYVPNGICTTYVHQHLKEGDAITINGPYGEFYLRIQRDIIFIAGGSGMAPVKSILADMSNRGSQRKARYFFGAKARRDLFLVEEMNAFEQRLPGFTFVPALSKPALEDNWDGEIGLITEVVDRHVADASECEAYLCGSPLMIDACIEVLQRKKLPDERIYYDKFA